MSASNPWPIMLLGVAIVLNLGHPARAQVGGGRGGDPEMRRQMLVQLAQAQLGVSDDEMKVLQPKLEKLILARLDSGGFGGLGGLARAGDAARGLLSNGANTPVGLATQQLRRMLDDKNAAPGDIAAKLSSLREARQKAREELAKTQKELQELLTARQEAMLVMWGLLD